MLTPAAPKTPRPDPLAAREMPGMLMQLGIAPALLKSDHPAIYTGMESICANCGSKDTCRQDLAIHRAAEQFADYCGNAATLSLLQGRPELARD
nr:hypothetical protein [uncultured Gellertiella sp.]